MALWGALGAPTDFRGVRTPCDPLDPIVTVQHPAPTVKFWSTAVDACGRNPRKLWQSVNELLQPLRPQAPDKLSAEDFAACFRSKVSNIRSSAASATPTVITPRHVPSMSSASCSQTHRPYPAPLIQSQPGF